MAEAVKLLDETKGDNLSSLKAYKLADAKSAEVYPPVADKLITSGDEFDKLTRAADKVLKFHKLSEHCSVVLIKNYEPMVFTYKLRSITFSTGLLELLTEDEAAAFVARGGASLFCRGSGRGAAKERRAARPHYRTQMRRDHIDYFEKS